MEVLKMEATAIVESQPMPSADEPMPDEVELYQVGVYAHGQAKKFEGAVIGYIRADEVQGLSIREITNIVLNEDRYSTHEQIKEIRDRMSNTTGIDRLLPEEVRNAMSPKVIRMNGKFSVEDYNRSQHPYDEGHGIDVVVTKQIYEGRNEVLLAQRLLK